MLNLVFPTIEKTSLKGSQLAGDLSFFNADFVRKKFSRKERKERKEMKGGNVVNEANGITQFAVRRTNSSKRT